MEPGSSDPGSIVGVPERETGVVARVEEADVPHHPAEELAVVGGYPAPDVFAEEIAEQAAGNASCRE
jgi:hypothetical protein